jgi:hypothetical protein
MREPDKEKTAQLILIVLAKLKKGRPERKRTAKNLKIPWSQYRWLEEKCNQCLQQKTQSLS